jgi:hypothetical protein
LFLKEAENKTLIQVACEELLSSMNYLKETGDSQGVMKRLSSIIKILNEKSIDLIISWLNEWSFDEYNKKGNNAQNLKEDAKLECLEILRFEFNGDQFPSVMG